MNELFQRAALCRATGLARIVNERRGSVSRYRVERTTKLPPYNNILARKWTLTK
jgi:hypothetical protein